MISYSKALDDEELIKAREESRSKPDFEKDYAKFLKKYKKSLKHHKPGYYWVPSGQGESYQYYAEHMEDTASREKSHGMTKSAEFLDYEANEARKARAEILDGIGLQQDSPAAVPVKLE